MNRDHHRDDRASQPRATELPSVSPGKDPPSSNLQAERPILHSGLIQRKAARDDNGVAVGAEQAVDRASASAGASLPGELRERFESSLGTDLSSVRVHTGTESATAAHAVGAKAYTLGNDIHFGRGQFDPSSEAGQHLLAHEVAHTVQQRGAAPARQHKLEVSTAGDAHEHEADHAADAMISGRTFRVAPATGLARVKVQRQEVAPVEISADDLPYLHESISEEQAARVHDKNSGYSWGTGSLMTTDDKGNPIENDANPVVANAKKNGSFPALKEMSLELDIVKPAIMAWQAADAAVSAIAGNTGIDPQNPKKYAAEFKALHDKMGNTKDPAIQQIKERLNNARQSKVKQAAAKVKGAAAKVRSCEAKVQARKAELEQAKLALDKEKNAAELAKINDAIQACVKSITYIGKAAAAIAGGVGAIEAMGASSISLASEADLAAAEKGTGAINIAMNPYMPSAVKTGGDTVGGSGDLLTKFFEMTLFKEDLDRVKTEASKINAGIAAAQSKQQKATTLSLDADLDAAVKDLDAAKIDVQESKESFMTNLLEAGRTWDQRNKSTAEIDKLPKSALPGKPGEASMEGLFGMFGAMTNRGAARDAFKDASSRLVHLKPGVAEKLVTDALNSGKATSNPDAPIGAQVPIDSPEYAAGAQRVINGMVSDNLRSGVDFVLQHLSYLKENDAKDAAIEAAWAQAVQEATNKHI